MVEVRDAESGDNITTEAFDMNAYIASTHLAGDTEEEVTVTSDAYTSVELIGSSDRVNFVYEIKADEGASYGTHFLRFRYRILVKTD